MRRFLLGSATVLGIAACGLSAVALVFVMNGASPLEGFYQPPPSSDVDLYATVVQYELDRVVREGDALNKFVLAVRHTPPDAALVARFQPRYAAYPVTDPNAQGLICFNVSGAKLVDARTAVAHCNQYVVGLAGGWGSSTRYELKSVHGAWRVTKAEPFAGLGGDRWFKCR